MAEFIDQDEYNKGMFGCATRETIKRDLFYIQRTVLAQPEASHFAREVLVKVIGIEDSSLLSQVSLEKLADDDGRPFGETSIDVDSDGMIVGGDYAVRGYLIGGAQAGPDGFNLTRDELLVPIVARNRPEEERPKLIELPLPTYEQ